MLEYDMTNTRRGFLGSAVAAGMLSAISAQTSGSVNVSERAANCVWRGWKPGEFQVHFIYTGVAESMFLIFPDSTTMLLDCGDHAAVTRLDLAVPVLPNPGRLAGDWVGRYVRRVNPNGNHVDYMMASHFHQDHTGTPCWQSRRVQDKKDRTGCYRSGFGLAIEHLHFRKAIDRGWPNYDDPVPFVESEWKCLEHMKKIYAYLAERDGLEVEKFRLGAMDQIVQLRNPASFGGFSVRNIAANGRIVLPDGTVKNVMVHHDGRPVKVYNENLLSLGMVFSYGKFKFYTAGDFSGPADLSDFKKLRPEHEIGKAAGKVDVAKINHHGHRSMPLELVRELKARAYVSCVWDQLHVTADTMTNLSDRRAYPGDRLICPGIMPEERRRAEGDEPWMKDVPKAVYNGAHIVLTVPPGGETYSLAFIDARDEEMKVIDELSFVSGI